MSWHCLSVEVDQVAFLLMFLPWHTLDSSCQGNLPRFRRLQGTLAYLHTWWLLILCVTPFRKQTKLSSSCWTAYCCAVCRVWHLQPLQTSSTNYIRCGLSSTAETRLVTAAALSMYLLESRTPPAVSKYISAVLIISISNYAQGLQHAAAAACCACPSQTGLYSTGE